MPGVRASCLSLGSDRPGVDFLDAMRYLHSESGEGSIMGTIVEQFTKRVDLVLIDGSRQSVEFIIEEKVEEGTTLYAITLNQNDRTVAEMSEEGFFDALRKIRIELEKDGTLLHCFGASEDVYPSGMQISMGPALLAYKMHLGRPSLSKDIVNIFDSDDSVKPSTVAQQELFRESWIRSLSRVRSDY